MSEFCMRVAGLTVAVRSMHDRIRRQAADYLIESHGFARDAASADLAIVTTQLDIDHERTVGDPGDWRDDYLETLAVFRRIAEYAPLHDRLVFHGATIAMDGRAYIFTAPSGTGKSTHISLWRRVFGDRVQIVNGDKPILRIERNAPDDTQGTTRGGANGGAAGDVGTAAPRVIAYGTPWAGKEGWQRNVGAPLAGICVVTRATGGGPVNEADRGAAAIPADAAPVRFLDDDGVANTCVRLDTATSLPYVARQTYMPADPAAALDTLGLLDALLAAVPVYRLSCTISEAAVRASSGALLAGE